MNNIIEFLRPELFVLVVVLWLMGRFLKVSPGFKQEWQIPYVLLGLGVVLSVLYVGLVLGEGFTWAGVLVSVIQGIIVAALAVFGNEMAKQAIQGRQEDNPTMYTIPNRVYKP